MFDSGVWQSHSCLSIYLHIYSLIFFSTLLYYRIVNTVPCAGQQGLVVPRLILSRLYLIDPSPPPFPQHLIFFFFFFRAEPTACGSSQARGPIGATPRPSNTRSEPCLWPAPQLMTMLDPQPPEQGQRSDRSRILVRFVTAEPQRELPAPDVLVPKRPGVCFVISSGGYSEK